MNFLRGIWHQLRVEFQVAVVIVALELALVVSSIANEQLEKWDPRDADVFSAFHEMERIAMFAGVSLILIELLRPKIARLVYRIVVMVRRMMR